MRAMVTLMLVFLGWCAGWAGMAAGEPPNIIVIVADDMGYADLGAYGCRDIATPSLDGLARSGVRFTDGYASHPFCSPTRAGFMACRYQHRFGYETNVAYDPQNPRIGLPDNIPTIAMRLRKLGYVTAAMGKWHLGAAHNCHPLHRGFQYFYGFLGGGHQYFTVDLTRPMHEGYYQPLDRNGKPEDLTEYLTFALSRDAVRFVREHKDKRFFLYLAYNAPHTPLQAPQEYLDRYASIRDPKRRSYAAMVSALDEGVGMLLQCLEELHLRQDTLIMFFSDNGGPTQANGSRNDPLRGVKGQVYEGGIRVPMLLSWPARVPAGGTFAHPVISIDLARTALEAAGFKARPEDRLEGVDLIPYVCGEKREAPHEALFWRLDNGRAWAVRSGPWKLLKPAAQAPLELYNLEDDVGERKNLAEQDPGQVERLAGMYKRWNAENEPTRFPSAPQYHRLKNAFYESLQAGR